MKRSIRFAAGLALAAALSVPGAGVLAVDPGTAASSFEVALLGGDGSVRSGDLFSKYGETFLVFWWSSCPHCVEALLGCERFFREYGGEDVTVVGINGDERGALGARGVIESNGITFPQARDTGGEVAASYGVPREMFTVCLVEAPGVVRAIRVDPQGDLGAAMEEMLSAPLDSSGGAAPREQAAVAPRGLTSEPAAGSSEGPGGISYRGLQRIRLLGIDTGAEGEAAGLYGEPVRSVRGVQYRLEVEASRRLAQHLRAGGLLRISNEGPDVLESGPEYFGSEWGSAFAEIEAARFRLRVGYYTLFMTPLTFMRWDWEDNPRVGGDTGCGCGGPAAGALLVESLEELGPDFTVEGALATYDFPGGEALVFYAIPRRALETSYSAYRYAGADRARFSQEIAGFEARWQRLDTRTGLFWKAGLHTIASFENERSVDFGGLGYTSADTWIDTWTLSATAEAPLIRYARLRGEIVARNETKEHGVLTDEGLVDVSREGGGGLGGIVIEKSTRLGCAVDYVRLAPDYYTPYAALSYESNAEGVRASGRASFHDDRVSVSVFYKRLREVDPPEGTFERKQTWLAGASIDLGLGGGFGASLGWLEKRSWRGGSVFPSDARRKALVASLARDFGKAGVLRLQYERVRGEETASDVATESSADLYSLYSSISF